MESCGHILKSKDYGDNDPAVRENAESVKKIIPHYLKSFGRRLSPVFTAFLFKQESSD